MKKTEVFFDDSGEDFCEFCAAHDKGDTLYDRPQMAPDERSCFIPSIYPIKYCPLCGKELSDPSKN